MVFLGFWGAEEYGEKCFWGAFLCRFSLIFQAPGVACFWVKMQENAGLWVVKS